MNIVKNEKTKLIERLEKIFKSDVLSNGRWQAVLIHSEDNTRRALSIIKDGDLTGIRYHVCVKDIDNYPVSVKFVGKYTDPIIDADNEQVYFVGDGKIVDRNSGEIILELSGPHIIIGDLKL